MIQAIKFKVIIEEDEKPTETKSGLYLGNVNLDGALRKGTVVSVGKDVRGNINVGDRVGFIAGSGISLKHEGKKYLNMFDTEVEFKFEE